MKYIPEEKDYKLFFDFIRNYSGKNYSEINNHDHFMGRFNRLLDSRRQFFYIADVIRLQICYTSPQVKDIFGVVEAQYDLSYNLAKTHPSDIERRSRIRARVIEKGQELFIRKGGTYLFSSNFMESNIEGEYLNVFVQCYMFYNSSPIETTYVIVITTPISESFANKHRKGIYHFYAGNDLSLFRYPDEELMHIGSNLSDREIEILGFIHMGLSSKEISEKMCLSTYTVNTHRRNIIKKTGRSSISEVTYYLDSIGMI